MNYHNQLVSRHITQWFHRVGTDELSPASTVLEVNRRILEYIKHRNLNLAIPRQLFCKHMCEFVCTFYKACKQNGIWKGPLSKPARPRGWTPLHETEWIDYLQYHHFSSEFWANFWNAIPEGMWETRTPRWRDAFQYILLHYIQVNPAAIEFMEDGSDSEESLQEE